jgi:hypothetical protein
MRFKAMIPNGTVGKTGVGGTLVESITGGITRVGSGPGAVSGAQAVIAADTLATLANVPINFRKSLRLILV